MPPALAQQFAQVDVRTYSDFLTSFLGVILLTAPVLVAYVTIDRFRAFVHRKVAPIVTVLIVFFLGSLLQAFVFQFQPNTFYASIQLGFNLATIPLALLILTSYIDTKRMASIRPETTLHRIILMGTCLTLIYWGSHSFLAITDNMAQVLATLRSNEHTVLTVQHKKYLILRSYTNRVLAFPYNGSSIDQTQLVVLDPPTISKGTIATK